MNIFIYIFTDWKFTVDLTTVTLSFQRKEKEKLLTVRCNAGCVWTGVELGLVDGLFFMIMHVLFHSTGDSVAKDAAPVLETEFQVCFKTTNASTAQV